MGLSILFVENSDKINLFSDYANFNINLDCREESSSVYHMKIVIGHIILHMVKIFLFTISRRYNW